MINDKQGIFDRLNGISDRIATANLNTSDLEITNIRIDILSLLEEVVNFYVAKNIFDTWAKDSLAEALADIRWNLGKENDSVFMLRACLVSIKISTLETNERSPCYPHNKIRASEIEKLSQKDFIAVIHNLRNIAKKAHFK